MKMKKFGPTEQAVYELALPLAEENGVRIWDVRFEKEGASWYLRVFIDRDKGISIEDCENVSRPLSSLLDEKDPISQSYVLEVGSAGLGRELSRQSHFEASTGKLIHVRMIRALDGERDFIVKLISFDRESLEVCLEEDGESCRLPLSDIAFVRLYEEFDEL